MISTKASIAGRTNAFGTSLPLRHAGNEAARKSIPAHCLEASTQNLLKQPISTDQVLFSGAVLALERQLSESYDDAFALMNLAHRTEARRVSGAPYSVHPTDVANIILELFGGNETVAKAGLLHDTVENCPILPGGRITIDVIRLDFGDEVADLVIANTQDKSLPKAVARANYIAELPNKTEFELELGGADKLSNLRKRVEEMRFRQHAVISGPERQKVLDDYQYFVDFIRVFTLEQEKRQISRFELPLREMHFYINQFAEALGEPLPFKDPEQALTRWRRRIVNAARALIAFS